MKRLFYILASFLIVIAFFRAVNGAGPLSLYDIIVKLDQFVFSFDSLEELFSHFEKAAFSDQLAQWQSDLGLFENLGRVLGSFFTAVFNWMTGLFGSLWRLILDVISLFVQVFNIVCAVLGFDFEISWNPGAYRGGR